MKTSTWPAALAALAIACGDPAPAAQDSGTDAAIDGGSETLDAGSTDAGSSDAGSSDAGSSDAGSSDAGSSDAGPSDAASSDAALDAPLVDDAGLDGGGVDPCAGGACGGCDDAIAYDSDDPAAAVRALGLCAAVVDPSWVLPDGSPAPTTNFAIGHGILNGFGTVLPPEGARLLAISTGTARTPSDPGYQSVSGYSKGYGNPLPIGFPFDQPACPGVITGSGHDGIALRFSVDVPEGANGFRLLLEHFTTEWPGFLCTPYNDQLAIHVTPFPPGGEVHGVAIDPEGNAISVNTSFLEVCSCPGGPPCTAGGMTFTCSEGAGALASTGFDTAPSGGGGATPWLEARVPVTAGTRITITVALWDSGDGTLDSTTIFDGFRWITDAPTSSELRVAP